MADGDGTQTQATPTVTQVMGYPAMNNGIAVAKKYMPILDEVFKKASLTGILDSDSTLAKFGANTNEIIIPKVDMDGLAKYDRKKGYVAGNVTLTHYTKEFDYERGRHFSVDAMDDEESFGMAFGTSVSEFLRLKVAPELDAYRFSKYATLVPDDNKGSGAISAGDDLLKKLQAALNLLDENEVDEAGRILFVTPTLFSNVEMLDTYKSKSILSRFSSIVKVPQARFKTDIKLNDGVTTGEEGGGFTYKSTAKAINFMILEKAGIMQYVKHTVNKIFSPEQNQVADAWQFNFRVYGLNDAYDNKAKGFYLHTAS